MENEGKYRENTNTITYLNRPIMKISKLIHIRTRIKTVAVSLVSILCSKDSEERTVPIRMEKQKYYVSSLLNSLFNNDVHTKQIHKRITNKTVPVSIVFYCVFEKYRTENVRIRMEEKNIMGKSPYHHYIRQYVIMVDIRNIFINVQRIKRYRFPLFLLCVQKIEDRKGASSG